ncbi:hypothetical protein EI94DRAFT_1032650 [Lactarius quietus]|nr:hypothetical protein EI94DRAFT_1032650 [Lactarius quietus]
MPLHPRPLPQTARVARPVTVATSLHSMCIHSSVRALPLSPRYLQCTDIAPRTPPTATLSLLAIILAAFIGHSVRVRRRRNAAFLAAIAAGTYVPPPPHNGKRRDDHLLPEPALWEVHTAPTAHNPEKRWADILPVAGATLVPVTQQNPRPLRRAPWSPRQFFRFGRSTNTPDPPPTTITTTSLEAPESPTPPPSEPVRLAVLISMPTRSGRGIAETGGPPVVEFGVTHVAYAHPGVDPAMSV